jgi:hypothetical protein
MSRPEPMRTNHCSGFVLPTVLGIILLAALFAAHAATETGTTALLAAQRLLQQRAFEAGESGGIAVLNQLQAGVDPAALQHLQSAEFQTDAATVATTIISRQRLPAGFSAGRVWETHYEIHSTGRSARGAESIVVQGVRQLRAVPTP